MGSWGHAPDYMSAKKYLIRARTRAATGAFRGTSSASLLLPPRVERGAAPDRGGRRCGSVDT